MTSNLNALKKTVLAPVGKTLISLSNAVRPLRSLFDRIGITPAHFGSRVVRVPIRKGRSLLLTGAGDVHIAFQLFWRGIDYYEPLTRIVIERLSAAREWFIDVGANIGFFALVAARLNARIKVIAFEPNPKMFAFLSEHKRLNRLANLTAEPLALSNRDGEASLFLNTSDMSASLVPDFQPDFNPALSSVPVGISTLDSYVRRNNIQGPLLLKVDVEGHDREFLEGAESTIARFKPDIIIEVLKEFDAAILKRLRSHGYRAYQITQHGLVESETVKLNRSGDFVFLNYLFTTMRPSELDSISETIRDRVRHIDLYRTSKLMRHGV
jgi:FkbM family methyltransferase